MEHDTGPAAENAAGALGQWLRTRRRQALLTQEQLAHQSGISERCIRMIESGRYGRPRYSTIRLLDAALSTALTELSAQCPSLVGFSAGLDRIDR